MCVSAPYVHEIGTESQLLSKYTVKKQRFNRQSVMAFLVSGHFVFGGSCWVGKGRGTGRGHWKGKEGKREIPGGTRSGQVTGGEGRRGFLGERKEKGYRERGEKRRQ